jgi:large subunit ribosomal protein L5
MAEARLYTQYKDEIRDQLREEFEYENPMAIPKLQKIVINVGVGDAITDKKVLDTVVDNVAAITGQQPVTTKAKKSISNFKLREGMPIGAKVTLRGVKMYEFLDRLITSSLPRVRDFSGIKATGFDGRGNYNLGVLEQIIFPEIDIDKVNKISGMDISFVTTAKTDKEAKSLLAELGLPFKKN